MARQAPAATAAPSTVADPFGGPDVRDATNTCRVDSASPLADSLTFLDRLVIRAASARVERFRLRPRSPRSHGRKSALIPRPPRVPTMRSLDRARDTMKTDWDPLTRGVCYRQHGYPYTPTMNTLAGSVRAPSDLDARFDARHQSLGASAIPDHERLLTCGGRTCLSLKMMRVPNRQGQPYRSPLATISRRTTTAYPRRVAIVHPEPYGARHREREQTQG